MQSDYPRLAKRSPASDVGTAASAVETLGWRPD